MHSFYETKSNSNSEERDLESLKLITLLSNLVKRKAGYLDDPAKDRAEVRRKFGAAWSTDSSCSFLCVFPEWALPCSEVFQYSDLCFRCLGGFR